ncbi:MAG: hypothetical protein KBD90_05070 [Alphaproteobacteria bacterium]|nr:hypothetical protein [Alphaproteobacteria bacterium]
MNKKFIQMLIAIVIFMGTSASSDEKRGDAATGARCPEREELHKWGQKFHVCTHSDIRNDWCPPPDPYFHPFSLSVHGAVVGGVNDSTLVSGSTSLGRNGWRIDEKTGYAWTYYQLNPSKSTGLDGPTPTCTYTVCSSSKPCGKGTCIDKPCPKDWIVGEITLLTEVTKSCGGKNYDIKIQGCCNGAVYDLKTQGCCNGGVYDPKTQGCCNGNLCYSPYVCAENKCCPEGSSSTLCGGECCSEASICVNGQCTPCSEGTKACPCPSDKKNCTPTCIPEGDTCKHGGRICPKGDVLCGGECMNPQDRYCKDGKIHACTNTEIIVNNACQACPEDKKFSVNNKCAPCPYGEVFVGKKCHRCINQLECKYKWVWDSNGICFSAVYATLSDGSVVNVSKNHKESASQKCCSDLVKAVQGFTSPFVCPGYGPEEWTQNSNYKCVPGACNSTPSEACESKCFNACKHNLNLAVVAACYWFCIIPCKL